MKIPDFLCLAPLIIIAGAPVLMMLIIAIVRNYKLVYWLSLAAYFLAFLSIYVVSSYVPHTISELLVFDNFSLLFFSLIIVACFFITLLSHDSLSHLEGEKEEYFIVMFIAALGSLVLVCSTNFVTLFLGLETLSVSLFILIAYTRTRNYSIEAGVKYLVLASVSSAFLLFGMGLIYTDIGSLEFGRIALILDSSHYSLTFLLAGFGMMIVGIGFKLALVPFHMWTPDIYQGAPTPVTTFIATVSKGAMMALFLRFFYTLQGFHYHYFVIALTIIAVLSMFTGNLLAIKQQNMLRIFAYSSIANLGYLLITLLIGNMNGINAAIFYLISYTITTLGGFGIISMLSSQSMAFRKLESYKGLFWKRPWIAIVFTLVLLSLAGIPITAGFMAKFYVIFTGIDAGLWLLVISLIINSVIGLYYYLRIITVLYMPSDNITISAFTPAGNLILAFVSLVILWLGIFPEQVFHLITRFSSF